MAYRLAEGEAVSGFLLANGNIIWDEPEIGHINIARQNGLLSSEAPLPAGRLVSSVKAAFVAVNENGQILLFNSGAYHTNMP